MRQRGLLDLTRLPATTVPGDIPSPKELAEGRWPKGRECADRKLGCITILSIYNPGPWCFCCAKRHKDELASIADEVDEIRSAA